MTIHAGPYIQRTIRDHLRWAAQYRHDAEAHEAKALELKTAAADHERKAAEVACGTDFRADHPNC